MHFVGGGISGYAPWATWLQILIIVGVATAGVVFVDWFSDKKKMPKPQP